MPVRVQNACMRSRPADALALPYIISSLATAIQDVFSRKIAGSTDTPPISRMRWFPPIPFRCLAVPEGAGRPYTAKRACRRHRGLCRDDQRRTSMAIWLGEAASIITPKRTSPQFRYYEEVSAPMSPAVGAARITAAVAIVYPPYLFAKLGVRCPIPVGG
jgi:hypothetical protein